MSIALWYLTKQHKENIWHKILNQLAHKSQIQKLLY
jgi:hypothetical protein